MARLRELVHRLGGLLRPRRRERELEEELRFHLEMEIQENLKRGLDPTAAERRARLRLGAAENIKEAYRDQRSLPALESVVQDLRYAARSLLRAPAFSCTAIVVLALGIGANSAVFSVADSVLLRPLPYPDAGRLAVFVVRAPEQLFSFHTASAYELVREDDPSCAAVAALGQSSGLNLVRGREARYVEALRVTPSLFEVLGVAPALGRTFSEDESGQPLAVIGHDLWSSLFGEEEQAIGSEILLSGETHTVVGVMPRGFRSHRAAEVYLPLVIDFQGAGTNYEIVGRIRPELELESADAAVATLTEAYGQILNLPEDGRLGLEGLQLYLGEVWRSDLHLLLGAVGLLLLIACANTASLLLSRVSSRRRELAIRSALGGGRRRLLQMLLIESLLLALLGGAVGVVLAAAVTRSLANLAPAELLRWGIQLDARVLVVTFFLSVLSGLLFGLAPLVSGRRIDGVDALHGGSRGSQAPGAATGRRLLVAAQVAISLALVVGAALLVQTVVRLQTVELGFRTAGVLTGQMSLQGAEWEEASRIKSFYRAGLERLRNLPGVEVAAVGNNLPGERGLNMPVEIPERQDGSGPLSINWGYVSAGYFEALDIPLLRGRPFDDGDTDGTSPVALVNESFVRRFFPDGEVLGRRVDPYAFSPEVDDAPRTIVGVVGDTKDRNLAGSPPPAMYVPLDQATAFSMKVAHRFFEANWIVRRRAESLSAGDLERAIREIAPTQPFSRFRTMKELVAENVATERFQASLLASFAALGLLMAAVGLYGLVSFTVAGRTREIGIRMALGSSRAATLRRVIVEGLTLTALGVAAGVAALLPSARLLESLVFGVRPTDPATLLAAALLLLVAAALASLAPGLRAANVDPAISVRSE